MWISSLTPRCKSAPSSTRVPTSEHARTVLLGADESYEEGGFQHPGVAEQFLYNVWRLGIQLGGRLTHPH